MTAHTLSRRSRWPMIGRRAATGLLLLAATVCLRTDLADHPQPGQPAANPTRSPPGPATDRPANPTVPRSPPVALRIPAIGVSVPVSALGLNPDGTVQVPTNFQQTGWFQHGPTPGQTGSAVILGHVDSYRGPAAFFRLRDLTAGDHVEVTLANGLSVHFVVTTVAMYPKDQFPARAVYGSHGYSALQLVTCGGTFDTHTRSYRSNLVVYTTLIATPPSDHTPTGGSRGLGHESP